MTAFFDAAQEQHIPQTYFTRGQMRQPQEVPDRTGPLLEGLQEMGIPVLQPADPGAAPIFKVHDLGYLRFLEAVHWVWMKIDTRGEEVITHIFVQSANHLTGLMAEAAQ